MYKANFTGKELRLILLCWLAYTFVYLARLNLSIAIPRIITDMGTTQAAMGQVVLGFFWCYAIGQLFSGYVGDRLSPKTMISACLLFTGVCNVLFAFAGSTKVMLVLWMLNGAAQSMLWAPIVKLLSVSFKEQKLIAATFSMFYTTIAGYLVSWSVSTVVRDRLGWRPVMLIPGAAVLAFFLVWLLLFRAEPGAAVGGRPAQDSAPVRAILGSMKRILIVSVLALACILQGFVRESINTWLPTVIEMVGGFSLSSSLGVLLVVPLINLFGVSLSKINSRASDSVYKTILWVYAVAIALPLAALFFVYRLPVLIIIVMVPLLGLMFSVNPMYTSFAPLQFRAWGCVATVAGLVDCFIYVGAGISGLVTGLLLGDSGGWSALLRLWLALLAMAAVLVVFLKRLTGDPSIVKGESIPASDDRERREHAQ